MKPFAAKASAECLIAFLRQNLPPDIATRESHVNKSDHARIPEVTNVMPSASQEQRRVGEAALASLVAQPGSGARLVSARELRYALRDLGRARADEIIASCVPSFLTHQGEEYLLSLDGLLVSTDRRPAVALRAMLELIAERYEQPNGRRQRSLAWRDVRARGKLQLADFTVAWITFLAAGLGMSGTTLPGSDRDETSPRFDYDFWLHEPDLEAMADNPTVMGWATLQRQRRASSMGTQP